jgi:hypothetical protein
MVSRQHALIFFTVEGDPILQDLNSANGTILNGQACQEQQLHNGDCVQIGNCRLEIDLSNEHAQDDALIPEDTAIESEYTLQVITRDPARQEGPEIMLPITCVRELSRAARALHNTSNENEFLDALVMILFQQFRTSRIWCSIRADVNGRPGAAIGFTEKGQTITYEDVELKQEIKQAMEKGLFMLVPSTSDDNRIKVPCSALIAPLMQWHTCIGVIYIDRSADWMPYTLGDLDHLMILSIQASVVLSSYRDHSAL